MSVSCAAQASVCARRIAEVGPSEDTSAEAALKVFTPRLGGTFGSVEEAWLLLGEEKEEEKDEEPEADVEVDAESCDALLIIPTNSEALAGSINVLYGWDNKLTAPLGRKMEVG